MIKSDRRMTSGPRSVVMEMLVEYYPSSGVFSVSNPNNKGFHCFLCLRTD